MGSEEKLETKILDTWMALDYRKKKWGVERIVYDAISNHFPADCGGTCYQIYFRQEGKDYDFQNYNPSKPVEEIFFIDDGNGYDYHRLLAFHSNKKKRDLQVGQFGEGLKLISAAALRENVKISFVSRNWIAEPAVRTESLDGEDELPFLCFKVTEGGDMNYPSSCTKITNPSQKLIECVLSLKERIIDFRDDLQEIKNLHFNHRVFVPKVLFAGELFVKKIKYNTDEPLLLTYQINGKDADSLLNPDRDGVSYSGLRCILEQIVAGFSDINMIKALLDTKTSECMEKKLPFYYTTTVKHPELWTKAFHQIYGENASEMVVLGEQDKPHINNDVRAMGFKIIDNIPLGLKKMLLLSGVLKVSDLLDYSKFRYDFVSSDALPQKEREVFELRKELEKLLLDNPSSVNTLIFSRAHYGKRDMNLNGICYINEHMIYIAQSILSKPKEFLSTYAHELVHYKTKAVDGTKEFEHGLTEALGKITLNYLREKHKNNKT